MGLAEIGPTALLDAVLREGIADLAIGERTRDLPLAA
jgi:hypothetical protein